MESFWKKVKLRMKNNLPDHSYRMWIEPIHYIGVENNVITLSCPNPFSKKRIKDNYLAGLEAEFSAFGYPDVEIRLDADGSTGAKNVKKIGIDLDVPAARKRVNVPRQMTLPGLNLMFDTGRMLKKDYTFDDFVVGENNDFAYSASLSLAQGANNGNGVLYLLSDTGLGKSHLSQAVGHHVMDQGRGTRGFYVTAEDFTNEMVSSLKNNRVNDFKEKYRKKCDVLILEDIHFLSGKDAIQKELAMTLDYLLDAEKKLIFSGCYLPDDIPKMNAQLRSRLTLGLITRINTPDFKTRVKILKKKSKAKGYEIPSDVTDYIAQELCDNVRQLESGLAGVAARSSLLGDKIDINLARTVLSDISRSKKAVTIEGIKKLVCREFNITEADIVSSSRKQKIVKPRQIAIFLARKYTDQPLKKIGRSFNRYHATAIYSINVVEKAMKKQGPFLEQLNYLNNKIESGKI